MSPQAVAAAVVATGATFVANAVGAALVTGFVAVSLTTTFVTTLVLTGVSMALAKKPKINPQSSMSGRSQMVKQPLISRKIVYGRQKVSGGIVYMRTTANQSFCT